MDLAGHWDLVIEQGASFLRYFKWEDSTGAAVDLADYSLRMSIRTVYGEGLIATSEGDAPTITIAKPGAAGVFTVAMTPAVTTLLDFNRAVYDIEADDDTDVYRVVQGNVTLSREATT